MFIDTPNVTVRLPQASPEQATGVPPLIFGPAVILDGDTLTVAGTKVRLFGIDAFEAAQRCWAGELACGANATEELRRIIARSDVLCASRGTDRYGRTLAVCRIGVNDIAAQMVRAGWAVAYRRYSNDYTYDELIAQQTRKGAWARPFQTAMQFQMPWDYRADGGDYVAIAQRFDEGEGAACVIKGNVTGRNKIYHLPSDPSYAQTKAEAMFCSEASAINAGFRRPKGN